MNTEVPTFQTISLERSVLAEYAKSLELTENGVKTFIETASWLGFRHNQIEVFDMTQAYGENIKDLSGSVIINPTNLNPNSNRRPSGFMFDPEAEQKLILVRGVVSTLLHTPNKYGQMQGDLKCLYVSFPETLKQAYGIQGMPLRNDNNSPAYYHPILRILVQKLLDVTQGADELGNPIHQTNVMFGGGVSGLKNFSSSVSSSIYYCARELGFTETDLCVWATTTDVVARRRVTLPNRNRNTTVRTQSAPLVYNDQIEAL